MGKTNVEISSTFLLQANSTTPRLKGVLNRYQTQLRKETWIPVVSKFKGQLTQKPNPCLKELKIQVGSTSEVFDDQTDESYQIYISTTKAKLSTRSIYGVIWGLESFLQMVQFDKVSKKQFLAKVPLSIQDTPQFSHCGLILDTSRNYYPVAAIKRTIMALSMNKMNVFHWHLMDSHS